MPLIYVLEDVSCSGVCKVKHISIKIKRQHFPFFTLIVSQMFSGAFRGDITPVPLPLRRLRVHANSLSFIIISLQFLRLQWDSYT